MMVNAFILQGRSKQSVAGSDRHVRDRSRERSSRRSSSPDSPPSPPLPDITVPFYMLPRADEHEVTIPPMSRPQLVSYPHLAKPAVSFPVPQSHSVASPPMLQNTDGSVTLSDVVVSDGAIPVVTYPPQYHQPPYQPPHMT